MASVSEIGMSKIVSQSDFIQGKPDGYNDYRFEGAEGIWQVSPVQEFDIASRIGMHSV